MATYAALVSLMNTLNNIQIHPRVSTFLHREQAETLGEIADFLLDFVERSNSRDEEDLESRIAHAAHAAEDVIEFHVAEQVHAGGTSSSSLLDLEGVVKDMNCVKERVMEMECIIMQPSNSIRANSSKPLTTLKNDHMVGFDDELIRLMERLTGDQPSLQVVPIVGMGGIGKTTLARNVYENLLTLEHFQIRAWVTISQEYSLKKIISEVRSCLGVFDFETCLESSGDELGLKLYQTLWGRRFLIVLDDIWSLEVWDKIKFLFPDNDCRSRVVITTRISNLATRLSSSSIEMNFLDEDKSWELFCREMFLEEGCPPELEKIGKEIVRECKGLPLSIVVIGGLLRNSTSTQEYWESFARDLYSFLMSGNDEHCLNMLSLSYNHLPAHLKSYFLHMGVFQEDEKISVSQLIKRFVVEGFLKPEKARTLEEVAEGYLKVLVDRNLVFLDTGKWNGGIKYCRMHDLVREVCLKMGGRMQFYRGCTSLAFKNQLKRVLNCDNYDLLEVISNHLNLRYIAYRPCSNPLDFPSGISSFVCLLWNLQTLVVKGAARQIVAKPEIWYMRQLRHLKSNRVFLPDPLPQQNDAVLPNLLTLSKVVDFSFTQEACKRIPNVERLCVEYEDFSRECPEKCSLNLAPLHKLESLSCHFCKAPKRGDLLDTLTLPSSLRKLCLHNCRLRWEDLNEIGRSLPHIEVLRLHDDACVGTEWDCVEGAFPRLKFLHISRADLISWTAEYSEVFPVLEKLHLEYVKKLEEIPLEMGEIDTLGHLHLDSCSESAAISSTKILEEQLSTGNEELKVEVMFVSVEEQKRFREKVEIGRFTSKNLVVDNRCMG